MAFAKASFLASRHHRTKVVFMNLCGNCVENKGVGSSLPPAQDCKRDAGYTANADKPSPHLHPQTNATEGLQESRSWKMAKAGGSRYRQCTPSVRVDVESTPPSSPSLLSRHISPEEVCFGPVKHHEKTVAC